MAKVKKLRDTDYLYISANIRALELKLVGRAKLERMLAAGEPGAALKILEESGWRVSGVNSAAELENVFAERRAEIFAELSAHVPNQALVDAFRVKYDYHNAKVLVKGAAAGIDGAHLLSGAGRVAPEKFKTAFAENKLSELPPVLFAAVGEAIQVLAKTGDPQRADFVLDRAYFAEFRTLAELSGSEFLRKYVRLSADAANLRSALRAKRSGQELFASLIDGGQAKAGDLIRGTETAEGFLALFNGTPLSPVLEAAAAVFRGAAFSEFEKQIDELLLSYLASAKSDAFSEKPVVAYIGAIENEIAAVRTVMSGLYGSLSADLVRSRLRNGGAL
ncbi:MAG: V-type ATPase subunit [Oscillospiraceae bacterium]|jgi:V/A-type H+-transporting ATPase subunit C|nr:V-type ATPase subunit [Oscillospiraceae bacterium]